MISHQRVHKRLRNSRDIPDRAVHARRGRDSRSVRVVTPVIDVSHPDGRAPEGLWHKSVTENFMFDN